ncbi:MAG: hypothetical protein LC753_17025 [Acidobacteria bacterium]|nr:hypothetical protein [Acidobacteriota bacterium]MCA1651888.1 hypothetical protein [Acidobacteriota bacterium]
MLRVAAAGLFEQSGPAQTYKRLFDDPGQRGVASELFDEARAGLRTRR